MLVIYNISEKYIWMVVIINNNIKTTPHTIYIIE